MRRTAGWVCAGVVLCAVALAAAAQSIPQPLQGWEAWVLHGHESQTCPLLASPSEGAARQCLWPGRLGLAADDSGATFQLRVRADAESWLALPGDRDAWPQDVRVDNAPAAVLAHEGAPQLRLAAGDHVVRGDLRWSERPARLRVPAAIALIDLNVDGNAVARPERDGDWLTLGAAAAPQRQADALDVRVFRRVADGAPPVLTTEIRLHVAGSAREQLLGPALPAGFVATALEGEVPARLDPDGRLRVQLRPGDWTLTLAARGTAPLARLALAPPPAPWPAQEIWSYADAPAFRTTRASGPQPIDPGQADVPDAWRALPAFVMARGAALEVQQRARGLAANAGDALRLQRDLWLDFDGRGLTAEDHLAGRLRDAGRVDVGAPWSLESAAVDGGDTPLLVTRGDAKGATGVEVRTRDLDLQASLRRARHAGVQSATGGWLRTLDGVGATLHLPYGYRLLGAPGADRSPDSWIARWNLLDLFVAALIALLAWRLLGWRWALVALGFVVLSHAEPGAPRWTPALAIAFGLVARVLPVGKLRLAATVAGGALLALAILASLPFAAVQVRDALHPQLENTSFAWIGPARAGGAVAVQTEFIPMPGSVAKRVPAVQEQSAMPAKALPAAPALPPPPAPPPPPADVAPQTLQTTVVTAARPLQAIDAVGLAGYAAGTVVQSGRGVPDWADFGSSYRLGWSGPVTVQQTWRMVILPAWATRILRIAMLALLVAWLAAIARAFGAGARWPRGGVSGTAAALAVALLLCALPRPAPAQSALPSPELLAQLRTRLLEAPRCAPDCAASPSAQVAVQAGAAQVAMEVDAGAAVAYPLPFMDAPAALRGVTLDGQPAVPLVRRDGALWIALERGVHRVALDFQLADGAAAALHFPMPPPAVQVSAPGWQVSGVDGLRLLSDTLTLTPQASGSAGAAGVEPAQAFPPYVMLTRNVAIGLDSRVDNVATRVSPAQGGFTVSLPLLRGEHASDAALKVVDGRAQLTFDPGQGEAQWSSTLDASSTLTLHAPALGERAETWRIASAPLLHLAFDGVPEVAGEGGAHVFRPLPGETLTVHITRPAAVAGASVAFDRVALEVARGEHAADSTLTLQTRSTRGGEQGIDLPRGAELLGAQRDGETLELNPRDGHVALPVQPGTQTFALRFREVGTLGAFSRTPGVALGAHAANVTIALALPRARWILWTWGPQAGPAVLYWAQLVVLLIVALALARFAPTPLRWWHWLLLGLGFSTFAWTAFVVVAAWLVALGWRERSARVAGLGRWPFNLVQVALAALTVIALASLVGAVPHGLLGRPDMRIAGSGSVEALQWFADQANGQLPRAGAFTLPLWCYKLAMLAWALWLANALIEWLRWGFHAWMQGGYWKASPMPAKPTLAERVAADKGDARP